MQNDATIKCIGQVFVLGHRAHHPLYCLLSSTVQYEQAPKLLRQECHLAVSTHSHLHDVYTVLINQLKPNGYVMHHQQFNIQQLYALPTLYLCVLYLSENKQRLVPLTA